MPRTTLIALTLFGLTGAPALAAPVTVDHILYDSSTNLGSLSGTIDMVLSGNLLTISLTNTSAGAAGAGAGVLLTGIGFSLPMGVSIAGGGVNMGDSTAINFAKPPDGDVSDQWGYDNGPLQSGMFNNYSYNTVVSSMESMTTDGFGSNSKFGGPDYGLASALETDKFGKGNSAIQHSVVISLLLAGLTPNISSNLVSTIERGTVGISFGSPNASTKTQVPEPASLLLFGGGAVAVLAARRRRH